MIRHGDHRSAGLGRSQRVFVVACVVASGLLASYDSSAEPATFPVPHEVVYTGKVSVAPVRARIRLTVSDDGRWAFQSRVGTRGWMAWKKGEISETSEFLVDGNRVASASYIKKDGFSDKDRNIETRFDDGRVVSNYRGEEIAHLVDGPVYDLLNLRIVLMSDLAHDRLQEHYQIVDGKGRLKTLAVRRVGEEKTKTKQGEFDTVRLEYDDDDKRFLVWIAPALDYQIVRIEQYKEGKLKVSLLLDKYSRSGG